ncbi:MAG: nucleotidyl transferase AbiEii/AbiGii toxin family protein [Hyphomonadaceae bacterium]|nr:nucleotidyl transferase AbiEii/AbiGii toxin family protein [Hyphomonadaceae bacterium]GIK48702.1 MAG: hypothetical protein BroJett013_13990 [Alphaproteobacteria bacterium]
MPLTKGQIEALKAIASEHDGMSYVAGSTPLNRDQFRFSADIDVFNDSEERASRAADVGAANLIAHGFKVTWVRRSGGTHTLLAERDGETVKLEWVADSDFRFFPPVPDPLFGYTLHPVDLAANKILAAANRRELRDLIDLLVIHENILPLGALTWAAVEKAPGFTPEALIAEVRRNMHYPREEWAALSADRPIDPTATLDALRSALDEAEAFVLRMPTDKAGRLFLSGDQIVQPDPDQLETYTEHFGRRGGHWPSSPEIAAAMMERFKAS